MKRVFLYFSFLFCALSIQATIPTFEFHDHTPPTHLADYIEVYEDKDHSFDIKTIQTIPFEQIKQKTPNFDHTKSTIWVHFKIHNGTKFNPFLRLNPEWFPSIKIYSFINGALIDSSHFGAIYPKQERPLHISAPNTLLKIPTGTTADIYLKLQSDHIITFDLTVADDASHYESHTTDIMFYFIFIGVMCCVLVYNFVLSISSSRIGNYFFVLYILCLIINTSFVKGFHDFAHSPYLANHSNIFSCLMVLFLTESIVHLTNLKSVSKKLHFARLIVHAASFISLLLNLFDEVRIANEIIINNAFIGAVWGLLVGWTIIKSGERGALTIFIAFFSFIAGGVAHILCIKGFLDSNIITTNSYVIGSGFQVTFFSFYLAGKLYNIRKERYSAQQEVLEQIQKNEQLVKQQNIVLENKVTERTKQLQNQNQVIKEKNKHITDSISYASYIQNAHLIPPDELNDIATESFILYRPKDILSGDFYYFTEANDHYYYIVADCTGHGVPGALLSITGNSILKELILVDKITDPRIILDKLNITFSKTLHQEINNNKDGMDITVVIRKKDENKLSFSAAKNPLIYFEKGVFNQIKGDRISIGGAEYTIDYTTHTVEFTSPISFYMYTDGYQDQFDSNNENKFKTGPFKNLLKDIHNQPFNQQYSILDERLNDWKGHEQQTDDILIMGVKLDLV